MILICPNQAYYVLIENSVYIKGVYLNLHIFFLPTLKVLTNIIRMNIINIEKFMRRLRLASWLLAKNTEINVLFFVSCSVCNSPKKQVHQYLFFWC